MHNDIVTSSTLLLTLEKLYTLRINKHGYSTYYIGDLECTLSERVSVCREGYTWCPTKTNWSRIAIKFTTVIHTCNFSC